MMILLTIYTIYFVKLTHYLSFPRIMPQFLLSISMLLEKIEQLAFLKRFNDEKFRSPLFGKPVGIIGHGGGTEEICKYYKEPVIDSIWNALSYPVEMNIIGIDNEQPRGVTFPVKNVRKDIKSIFPVQEYDWGDIELRLSTLVHNVLREALKRL
ncbi:MAG: hypothetical protein A2Y92_00535 [Chloroflexi bacterium RBG_13_57_8]|nr:MAG: hypothetical protein A2Y92_00535 [Chloroflexi bacterium RBG_13_57_8]